jgi:hypothetical protein
MSGAERLRRPMSPEQRAKRNRDQRDYRHRQRNGIVIVPVPCSYFMIEEMLNLNWVSEEASRDRYDLGKVIGRVLQAALLVKRL